ncbi:MAG: methyltransferase [Campylobacter sp.]|nr:methyltransferase [Campylobacter sp.]
MTLYQLKDGYRYNSDTIMLYKFALELNLRGEILEVGAGCGVLGLLLKRDFSHLNLTLMDIQEENITLCRKNSVKNSLPCDIIHADFGNFKSEKRYNTIISNPPFYHDGVIKSENLHLSISRYSKYLNLRDLISNSSSHLKPCGSLVFCYDAKQLMDIAALLEKSKFRMTKIRFIHTKIGKSAKIVLIEAKKNSKSLCDVGESLYLSQGDGYSTEVREIFKKANLKSIDV